ncbi:MAG: hypothetical protein C0606_07135 [Hyphomicrobiales bacterium]|nr:MAG: hypothetical protein C0606_07135 [Hyphomicrobiales bacterium]
MTHTTAIRPEWTPVTVGLMVLGFVVFWPLGLAMLAYILWGDRIHEMVRDARGQFNAPRAHRRSGCSHSRRTGNVAFDEYRDAELKRLEEERRRLDEMRAEFDAYMADLRRARDKEEFDRFMSERRPAGSMGDA